MSVDSSARLQNIKRLRTLTRSVEQLVPQHMHLLEHLLFEGLRLEAENEFERMCKLQILSADAFEALAFYARRLDKHELSNDYYKKSTALAPDDPKFWHNLATSERSLGRTEEAVEACNEAIKRGGDPFPTILLRSDCRRATSDCNHVSDLRDWLAKSRNDREKMFAGYALGKELHDIEEFAQAFEAFRIGAEARRRNLSYDVTEDEHKISRIIELYREIPRETARSRSAAEHIFIVGLPRSGTTLTERILLGLPETVSNGETDNFASALIHSASTVGGDLFERCANAVPSSVSDDYCRRANPRGTNQSIIEKLPMNYLYAGAIARSLKSAKIIWVRRHPVDSCFAMYRTLFAEAYPFSYDFSDLARYYAAYQKLMWHWVEQMPEVMLTVDYEELVNDPTKVGQRMAEHCNLAWIDSATEISRVGEASLTASASQIRENIYTRSSGIWQHYEKELRPLVSELKNAEVL